MIYKNFDSAKANKIINNCKFILINPNKLGVQVNSIKLSNQDKNELRACIRSVYGDNVNKASLPPIQAAKTELATNKSGGKENDAESWKLVSQWALKKRAKGLSIIFIHHSGKDGSQRGTSKREDVLDTVISLKHPYDYEPSQGARFEIHFAKCRHLYREDVKPITVNLDNYQWQIKTLVESNKQKILEMHKEGLTTKEIVAELGISRQAVHKHLKNVAIMSSG